MNKTVRVGWASAFQSLSASWLQADAMWAAATTGCTLPSSSNCSLCQVLCPNRGKVTNINCMEEDLVLWQTGPRTNCKEFRFLCTHSTHMCTLYQSSGFMTPQRDGNVVTCRSEQAMVCSLCWTAERAEWGDVVRVMCYFYREGFYKLETFHVIKKKEKHLKIHRATKHVKGEVFHTLCRRYRVRRQHCSLPQVCQSWGNTEKMVWYNTSGWMWISGGLELYTEGAPCRLSVNREGWEEQWTQQQKNWIRSACFLLYVSLTQHMYFKYVRLFNKAVACRYYYDTFTCKGLFRYFPCGFFPPEKTSSSTMS